MVVFLFVISTLVQASSPDYVNYAIILRTTIALAIISMT